MNWEIVYTFPEGNINHIHGLFLDPYTNLIWVATGDRENECIIGYTSDGFGTFNIAFRGGQDYRAANLLFYKDFIIYATDSQYINNEIKMIDRRTLNISVMAQIQGSGIYGGQCGNYGFFRPRLSHLRSTRIRIRIFGLPGTAWIGKNYLKLRRISGMALCSNLEVYYSLSTTPQNH